MSYNQKSFGSKNCKMHILLSLIHEYELFAFMTSSFMILFGVYHVDDKKFLSKLNLIKFNLNMMLITSWCH